MVFYWNPPPVPSSLSFTPPLHGHCPAYSLMYNPIPIWYDLPPNSSPLSCSDIWGTGKLEILVGKSNGSPHSVWMISFTQKFYFANLKKEECSFRLNKPWCSKPCTNPLFLAREKVLIFDGWLSDFELTTLKISQKISCGPNGELVS